jgi:aspartyl-tRNA(Asn)/glutamyl-tRNA(Gln) amidotransferase subunit B
MEQLKAILEYTDVCDCKMQEGSLRCDANISVMPEGATEFGTRAEIKNLNSFRALERAIEYEVERQIELVEDGGHVVQETRTWDDANGVTLSMRSKEEAHDYRYFPEPDLVPINLDQAWIDEIKATLPELPSARKERLLAEEVPEDNADIIVASKKVADYFDAGAKATKNLKALSNWVIGDVAGYLNAEGLEIDSPEFKITPDHLGELVNLIDKGVLSSKLAKQVFAEMLKENEAPQDLVKKLGLEQVSDAGELGRLVDEVIAANPQSIADFKAGKKKALGFLVGQIMKATKGKANPGMVNKMLMEKLQ